VQAISNRKAQEEAEEKIIQIMHENAVNITRVVLEDRADMYGWPVWPSTYGILQAHTRRMF
jgi:hypothetical protein